MIADDVADMFAELDGYDRYQVALETWSAMRAEASTATRYRTDAQFRETHKERLRANYYAKQGLTPPPRRQPPAHGTTAKYIAGCRCEECKAAVAKRERERYAAKHAGRPLSKRGRPRKYQEAA